MSASATRADPDATLDAAVARLVARFREIAATSMKDVPICNDRLGVDAIGFRRHGGRAMGMLVTPWFLNLAVFDLDAASPPARAGAKLPLALPAGEVELIVGEAPGFGRLDMCSLYSPMSEFADMAAARETARLAMIELTAAPTPPRVEKPALDRRAFLRGALAAKGEAPA